MNNAHLPILRVCDPHLMNNSRPMNITMSDGLIQEGDSAHYLHHHGCFLHYFRAELHLAGADCKINKSQKNNNQTINSTSFRPITHEIISVSGRDEKATS